MQRFALPTTLLVIVMAFAIPSTAPAADATLTDDDRAALVELLVDSRAHVEELVASTPDALWAEKPADGGWSVSEVVEHLVMAEPMIRGMAEGALASDPDPEWETTAAMDMGQFVSRITDRSQSFQAPEPLQPAGGMARDEALRKFSGERAVTLQLVRTTTAPVKMHTAEGPPGKMNAQQWLTLVGAHTERHAGQIEEALAELVGGDVAPEPMDDEAAASDAG